MNRDSGVCGEIEECFYNIQYKYGFIVEQNKKTL